LVDARRYTDISADGHIETPPDAWVRHVPERWRDRAPRLVSLPEGGEGWVVEGQPMLHNGPNLTGRGPIRFRHASYWKADGSPVEGAGDARQRLREQDEDGLDAEVLFPPVFASKFLEGIADPAVYEAMVAAFNSFLAEDYCAVAPDRLIGNAVIPVCGIDAAVRELSRASSLGLRAVSFHQFPNGTGAPTAVDDRFWEAALEAGVALAPHFGFGHAAPPPVAPGTGVGGLDLTRTLGLRAGTQPPIHCLVQLLTSGVFDRFPEIRFYFAETNASWLPSALYFLDDNYALYRDIFGAKWDRSPSEQILAHCWFGIVRDPVAFRLGDAVPWANLMWGSDFPHSVGTYPASRQHLDEALATVDPAVRRRILLENPAEFFGLDLEADLTPTPAP
jgi:predicted TIM-barrel fold metal-dependent hydrolase